MRVQRIELRLSASAAGVYKPRRNPAGPRPHCEAEHIIQVQDYSLAAEEEEMGPWGSVDQTISRAEL